ncbi:MAG: PIN domain-containing protein [Mycobacteriales bacterium]
MIGHTADTSVVIPALTQWHQHHQTVRAVLDDVDRLPAHVLAESFSVLTRLPHGLAVLPADAAKLLRVRFPGPPLVLDSAAYARLPTRVAKAGLRGGQVYDALIAATVAAADVELLTLDTRAYPVYTAMGVRFRAADGVANRSI